VVRKARHRNWVFTLVSTGYCQAKLAARDLRVLVEKLVKVTHAEEQKSVATRFLRVMVLLHHRCNSHSEKSYHEQCIRERRRAKGNEQVIDPASHFRVQSLYLVKHGAIFVKMGKA
jgi:hypothetical protein